MQLSTNAVSLLVVGTVATKNKTESYLTKKG